MRVKRASRNIATLVTVLLLVLIAACAPTPEEITPTLPSGMGIIEIRVTDPPPPGVESAVVTVEKIEAHRAVDAEYKWEPIFEDGEVSFDLIEIFDELVVLGWTEIEAGSFTQIRMEVKEVIVTPVDGDPVLATIPSGKLKIVRPFNVEPGMRTILTLDFDGDKSLKIKSIEGKDEFLFNPVVKLVIEKVKLEG